eukprot:643294-Hanusia_phi.AAC.3
MTAVRSGTARGPAGPRHRPRHRQVPGHRVTDPQSRSGLPHWACRCLPVPPSIQPLVRSAMPCAKACN